MTLRDRRGWGKIIKYWLPFESSPSLDSISVDEGDVWFYIRWYHSQSIGQIRLRDSEAEFNHVIPFMGKREGVVSIEEGIYRVKRSWRGLGQGIAAHNGYVWYGEREGVFRMRWRGPGSGSGSSIPEKQALCKMHAKTHKVTRFLFPSPEEIPLDQLAYRLGLDPTGRRVWGATHSNKAWLFDISTNKLRVLTIGGDVEKRAEEHISRRPQHIFRDVAVEPKGERGWIADYIGALYLLNLEDESLLKYPFPGSHPRMVDLSPDGKVWFTSVGQISIPGEDLHPPRIELGYVHCLNPDTDMLYTYLVLHGFALPQGVLVTDEGEIWFGYGYGRYSEGGISRLNPEKAKSSKKAITPEEPEEWGIEEYDVTEAEEEELHTNTFKITPDKPVKREYLHDFSRTGYKGFDTYEIERSHFTVRDLAQDSKGRIWFTTWRHGYIGVIQPLIPLA